MTAYGRGQRLRLSVLPGAVAAWAAAALLVISAAAPARAQAVGSDTGLALSDAEIVRRVLPSVVNITIWRPDVGQGKPAPSKASGSKAAAAKEEEAQAGAMEPVDQFYGSGFVIDPSGLILTNQHVVEGAADITVTFSDGTRAGASLCGYATLIDLAVVKLKGMPKLPAITWGDSQKLSVGDSVLAIGNPFGVGVSVSSGIISALHRTVSSNPFDDYVQTDAAINHGNSGGPLVDMKGQVVGVNTKFLSDRTNGGSLGVGFAIPSMEARLVSEKLGTCRQDVPGWIGVTVQRVTPDIARALGLNQALGAIVTGVVPDGPAKTAGIQEGDVIETLDGAPVSTPLMLLGEIALSSVGKPIRLSYWRDGHTAEAAMKIGPWPGISPGSPRREVQAAAMRAMDMHGLGVHFTDRKAQSGDKRVVVSDVEPGSAASDAGLQRGDVVLRVESQPAETAAAVTATLQKAAREGRRSVLLLVESGGRRRFVAMPVGMA